MHRALRLLPALVLTSMAFAAGPAHAADTVTDYSRFQVPSHNTACALTGEMLRCDIAEHTWKAPLPKPEWCREAEWGHGVYVAAFGGDTGMICADSTDTFLDPSLPVLEDGVANHVGLFTCTSMEQGVYCYEDETGHGFMLSPDFYGFF